MKEKKNDFFNFISRWIDVKNSPWEENVYAFVLCDHNK